jgi:ABC-2 type transport system ATP-binding protein
MKNAVPGDAVIVTSGLTKRYGRISALSNLNLSVPPGVIYGFLGPNGAGKTTAIRLLMGFIRPTSGSATIAGHDTWRDGVAARRDLGYLVESDALYPDMSGRDQLDYAATVSGREPVLRRRVLDALELSEDALGRRLGSYSKGMRQKLALTAALQHDPALLILDEPTDGLDPLIQHAFEEVLTEQRDRGRTIFMSSHDLAEVERVCERVAVVRGGELILEGAVAELTQRHRRTAEVRFAGPVPESLANLPRMTILRQEGSHVTLAVDGDVTPLVRYLAGTDMVDLLLAPPRLEDIFLGLYDTHATNGRDDHPVSRHRAGDRT